MAPPRRPWPYGALVLLALASLVAVAGAAGAVQPRATPTDLSAHAAPNAAAGSSSAAAMARGIAAIQWRGGPITTSANDVVRVFVSTMLPEDTVTPEAWGEFLSALTHGPELTLLTTYVATLPEVQVLCGPRTLGCYTRNRMVVPDDTMSDRVTAEEVARHEYGHHVAFHRSNAPWPALDWGPKRWASTVNVCARVRNKEAFPGEQTVGYAQNPGEAWAEVYRLMDERRAGITTQSWEIVSRSFFPGEAALLAAEADVLDPWRAPTSVTARTVFGKATRKTWLVPVRTPHDGNLRVRVQLPRGGTHDVVLLSANRKSVLARANRSGPRGKQITTTVCGQRSLVVRVTQKGALGPVAVTVTTP